MRIAYCIPSLYFSGGMERVISIKANYFADVLGYEIFIILTDEKEKRPYYELSSKIHIINLDINFNELWNQPFYRKTIIYLQKQYIYKRRLRNCLYQIKPDFTISMLRREINFITSIHDGSFKIGEIHFSRDHFRDFKDGREKTIFKKIVSTIWTKQLLRNIKKLDAFITLTQKDKDKWPELNNITVIQNPLPFFPEQVSTCDSFQAIAVGRYDYIKGIDLLIETWNLVSKKYPDWSLQVYGDGNLDNYQKRVVQLGLEKTCFLQHAVKNIVDKYCESSIFVLSSRNEGFGMVIIEAMACGVPVVSFDCPFGPREIITDGKDGFLVENGNIVELANNICNLIENDILRKEMGRQARINVERFKMENIANQWKELFESLCKNE